MPENISFEQAASIPVALATIVTGLWSHHPQASSLNFPAPWEEGGMTKFVGQAAFIIGGSSSVGQYGTYQLSVRSDRALTNRMTTVCVGTYSYPASEAPRLLTHHHDLLSAPHNVSPVPWSDPCHRSRARSCHDSLYSHRDHRGQTHCVCTRHYLRARDAAPGI